MGLENELFTIKVSQNEAVIALALSDYKFYIATNSGRVVFTDEDIKLDEEGRYIIDLSSLGLGIKKTEVPKEVLEYRAEARRRNAIERNTICIERGEHNGETHLKYFYFGEDDQLVIKIYESDNITYKEAVCDKIEVIHGKKAVKADSLGLFPYIVLPAKVIEPWEKILREKELKKLALILVGKSLLDGKKYYGFNLEPSAEMWTWIEKYFVHFDSSEDELTGWLTCTPGTVAAILNIPIDAGL